MTKNFSLIPRTKTFSLLTIFILSIAVRLAFIGYNYKVFTINPDAYEYLEFANNIIEHRSYGYNIKSRRLIFTNVLQKGLPYQEPLISSSWRPPAYSFLIAIAMCLTKHFIISLKIFQALLGGMTTIFVCLIAQILYDKKTGYIAGLLFSLYPATIVWCMDISSEILFAFLLILTILLNLISVKGGKKFFAFGAGVSLGLASLTRANGIILLVPIFVWQIIVFRKAIKKASLNLALFSIGFILFIIPWTVRNYKVHHRFIPISTQGGYNTWAVNNLLSTKKDPALLFQKENPDDIDGTTTLPLELENKLLGKNEGERSKIFWTEFFDFVRDSPDRYLALVFKKIVHFWRPMPTPTFFSGLERTILLITTLPIFIFGIIGLILSFKKTWFFLPIFLITTLFHAIFSCANIRYRIPFVDPLLIISTSFTLCLMWRKSRMGREQIPAQEEKQS